MNVRVAGNGISCPKVTVTAAKVRNNTAGFLYNAATGRNVPLLEPQFPKSIKTAAGGVT